MDEIRMLTNLPDTPRLLIWLGLLMMVFWALAVIKKRFPKVPGKLLMNIAAFAMIGVLLITGLVSNSAAYHLFLLISVVVFIIIYPSLVGRGAYSAKDVVESWQTLFQNHFDREQWKAIEEKRLQKEEKNLRQIEAPISWPWTVVGSMAVIYCGIGLLMVYLFGIQIGSFCISVFLVAIASNRVTAWILHEVLLSWGDFKFSRRHWRLVSYGLGSSFFLGLVIGAFVSALFEPNVDMLSTIGYASLFGALGALFIGGGMTKWREKRDDRDYDRRLNKS